MMTIGSKKLWSFLLPPSSERRQGLRCRSETLLSEKDKVVIDENPEGVALGADYLAERGFSANPLFSRRYPKIWKHRFGERASTSQNEAALHNFYSYEYKEGFLGRVGSDHRGVKVMVLPSTPKTRVIQSLNPSENREKSEFFDIKDDDGAVGQNSVGFPNLVLEVNQTAHPSQVTDSVNPMMPNTNPCPIQTTVSQSVFAGSPTGEFQIEGISPRKMAKVRDVLKTLDIKVYSRRKSRCSKGLGLGSRKKRRVVKDFLRSEKPDIVMIQETKKAECDRSEEVVLGSFSVSVKFAVDGSEQFWISTVYGPNSTALRKDFWVELSDIFGLSSPCWCVGGDFNVIRRCSEKLGGGRLTPSMKDLDDFIRENELIDPPLRSASFTWSNMQEHPVCKRLDRFLYSNEWEQLFPQSLQEVLPRWTSDHWPIVLETNPFKWGPTPFRFENMWLHHPSFKECFGRWWREFQGDGWEGHKFMRRLQFLKAKLKEWNKNAFGDLIERKKCILLDIANFDSMEQEGGLSPELLIQRAVRKGELEELILREEIHWRQKARVKWVKEGDCNSKFFHKVANGRRNRKFIKVLENERGLVLDNSDSIKEEILRYFEKLYASPSGESWSVEGLDWSPISRESASRLESPFTEEEIYKAIFQMDRDKAPGPDGFTIAVFQDCWDVIKEDLVRVFDEFHRSGIINQRAFVQGRQILDAVLIANEIVDEKKRSGEEGVVFKIDFEKAYDHVSWDFLDHVMEKKGFNPKWRKWIRGCLSSVSFAILVNGNAKGWVKASRGLRQGDPLSPFLFTIVADVLSRMLLRAEERNVFEGFRVGRNRTRVSHLQFADDTIFFSSTREEDLLTLKSVLVVFGHISRLKVNLDKSNMYGINLGQDHLHRLAELLDCKALGWPILYLGLPLGGNPKSGSFWDPVIERISSRLDGWQKAYLSFGGRITLIQSCLTHMPCYFLSLFKIPASMAGRIERLQRDFLWSGVGEGKRDHLVSWDVVCKSKMKGVILSIYGSHSNGWDANTVVRWSHRCPWKAIAQVFQDFSKFTRFMVGDGDRIRFWEDLWWGDQSLGVRFPRLLRVVMDKNIPISSILGSTRPFSWNFNFRRNLSDSEIEEVESLMQSLDHIHLSPSVPDKRSWSLSSSGLFTVKSFFLALSQISGLPSVFPTKLVWNSQVPFKIKSFVWLVAHKKLTKIEWVPPRSICDMLSTNFNGFGSSKRGIILWQAACIAILWVFQKGDLVMVHLRPERFHPSTYQKLQAKKIGLLWVLKQLGENAYLLELPSKLHFNPIFNVEDLDLQLPPSLSLHLEIEHILDDQRVST
ncbi:LINE-1 retrotransposable element ORF2 protein [Vitis vinifera]|uniref:LINE-1 retrotransposable element ORF2 protein n=1 Tax=Vitis vinifera TaxID=29760 RepID=A0A438KE15_VITVI|nr:LINE-1 retrotransposable element ORF2 protein [Vitis vinifera]